jgi:hypothetical protein
LNKIIPATLLEIGVKCEGNVSQIAIYQDIMHRIVYIADDFLNENQTNIITSIPSKALPEIKGCLAFFAKSQGGQNPELNALCS